ncbi:MAG TPA: DnaJ domain-containing protein [Ktedonobacteraceae bacterium]|nr:DnaJ domain-containing protein [Ktedonobacteraceae bacterium]
MPNERACLSALRGVSARAAAILDHYTNEQALWVPVGAFQQFAHTLHWGRFEDLDLCLLDGLDVDDRGALLEELRAYNAALQRQRDCVDRFHRAYRQWIDQQHEALPSSYRERLRKWQRRYGRYDYYRVTGLGTQSGIERFLADPEENMRAFEQAFLDLEEQRQRERARHKQAEADWWANLDGLPGNGYALSQLDEALHLLGLSPGATLAEIQRAYRAYAKLVHPDRQGAGSTERMAALNRAYAYLRKLYRSAEPEMRRAEA